MKSNITLNSSHKNFLIISQYYYPDITAAAFRIKETVDILNSRGHNVTVITAKPHRGKLNGRDSIDDGKSKVIRVPIVKYRAKSKWHYILHYASFMIMAIIIGLIKTKKRQDVIIASSPPLFVGISGYIIAKLKRAKFVLDIRDIWPDSAAVIGKLERDGVLYKYAKKVEKFLYVKADIVSCVAKPMAEYIKDKTLLKKVIVVYNGVPEVYLNSNKYLDELSKDELFLEGKIRIVYIGNMGYCQDLGLILESAKLLREKKDNDVIFYLIGDGAERFRLEQIKAKYKLDNVMIEGPISKDEAIKLVYNSSALFLQLKEDETMKKTIPSKVFDYMIAGKPILFGIRGEGKEILEGIKGNIFFNSGSVISLLTAIENLRENYNYFLQQAKDNRRLVEKYYTREKMVEKLEQNIQMLFDYGK